MILKLNGLLKLINLMRLGEILVSFFSNFKFDYILYKCIKTRSNIKYLKKCNMTLIEYYKGGLIAEHMKGGRVKVNTN